MLLIVHKIVRYYKPSDWSRTVAASISLSVFERKEKHNSCIPHASISVDLSTDLLNLFFYLQVKTDYLV